MPAPSYLGKPCIIPPEKRDGQGEIVSRGEDRIMELPKSPKSHAYRKKVNKIQFLTTDIRNYRLAFDYCLLYYTITAYLIEARDT